MEKRLPPTSMLARQAESDALITAPATTLKEVIRACNAEHPLDAADPRWQDLSEGRGDRAVHLVQQHLERKSATEPLHLVFASHRGAGKSTELLRLQSALAGRYETLYLQANIRMDPRRIEAEDLLLVLAAAVEEFLRDRGTPLPPELLERVNHWFSEVVKTTAWGRDFSAEVAGGIKAEGGIPRFAQLVSSVTALFKVESRHREEVKLVLKKYPGTLLDSVNHLLDSATERLGAEGKELLVIIDNLDRYTPQVVDELLIRGGDRIRELRCNLLLTPPIGLIYRPESEQLDTYYRCEIMNTVRLRQPDQPYDAFDGQGRELLLAALEKRMDIGSLIPDPLACNRLVTASGGAIRDLLDLVADASLLANGPSISREDVEQAVRRRRQRMRDLINANGFWPTLVRVAEEKQIFDGDACMQVLFHRLVFKYNGDGWYDVHPLVTEMPEFRREYERAAAPR